MRDFWRSHPVGIGEFADRFTGSADLYATGGRRPTASVNLITVHDGFTVRDLVSYNDKHNEANGEDNRDGTSDNESWNCGAEGPADDDFLVMVNAWWESLRCTLPTTRPGARWRAEIDSHDPAAPGERRARPATR